MAVSDEEQKPVAFCLKEIADSKSLIVTIAAAVRAKGKYRTYVPLMKNTRVPG